jgi:RNA polymerase sigma factor (sigma-70 family)
MSDENIQHGSVTGWLRDLENGDQAALNALADRYFERIASVAKLRLMKSGHAGFEGDDVAVEAFIKLLKNLVSQIRSGKITNRETFWFFILAILRSVIIDFKRKELAARRGGKLVRNVTDLNFFHEGTGWLLEFVDKKTDHESLITLEDSVDFLLNKKLKIGTTREVAKLKLQGFTNQQIADQLGIDNSSVRRKLDLIEKIWRSDLDEVEGFERDDSETAK